MVDLSERTPAYGLTRIGGTRHILREDANETLCGRGVGLVVTPTTPDFAELAECGRCRRSWSTVEWNAAWRAHNAAH